MKIALFTETLPTKFTSGVSVYTVELAKELLNLNHQVIIFAPRQKPTLPKSVQNITIHYIPTIPSTYPNFYLTVPFTLKILNAVRNFKPDIIHTQAPSFLGIDATIVSKILKVPCVSTFQTLFTEASYIKNVTKFKVGLKTLEKISWRYHKWFYNLQNGIFVSTPMLKQMLIDHRFNPSKIFIIPLAIDLSPVKVLKANEKLQIKQKYQLKSKVAVYSGRVSAEKNLDKLIRIWSQVVREYQECSLLIIGDGPFMTKLSKLISEYNLEEFIKPIGVVDHEILMSSGLLSVADFFVSTSISETFGLGALEATAHGLPVILYKSQGFCEFIKNEGIIVNLEDEIKFKETVLKFINEDNLRNNMGQNAAKLAKRFDTKVITKKTVNLYQNLIHRKSN